MNEAYNEMLTKLPLFAGFTTHGTQAVIEAGQVRECAAGEVFFKEGDAATVVLLVLKGKLQVFVERGGRDMVLMDSQAGSIVGELAVLCGIPRSASVRASEPAVVLEWSAQQFHRLLLTSVVLSQRVFRDALRMLIDKERSLIESLVGTAGAGI
jgi:CRP-like cAMP-binding protein